MTTTTTTTTTMKKKQGPKFRALEPWQRLIIEEKRPARKVPPKR